MARINCKTCGTTAWDDESGWYALSVTTPRSEERYSQWVGMFCSSECLQRHMPEVTRMEQMFTGRRERERAEKVPSGPGKVRPDSYYLGTSS